MAALEEIRLQEEEELRQQKLYEEEERRKAAVERAQKAMSKAEYAKTIEKKEG